MLVVCALLRKSSGGRSCTLSTFAPVRMPDCSLVAGCARYVMGPVQSYRRAAHIFCMPGPGAIPAVRPLVYSRHISKHEYLLATFPHTCSQRAAHSTVAARTGNSCIYRWHPMGYCNVGSMAATVVGLQLCRRGIRWHRYAGKRRSVLETISQVPAVISVAMLV
jgi:hypothetical protein